MYIRYTERRKEATMNHFSLFTGIGGIDLAAEWAGFNTVGQVELAEYPYQILMKHWPEVPKFRNVKDVNRNSIRNAGIEHIDLISAGFPCQPHSLAGKRKGSCDDRDLWPEVARVLSEIKPKWFLGENVKGLLSSENGRFFGTVLGDLAEMGYDVGWGSWEAARVGAPHRRERVFIVAHSNQLNDDFRGHGTGKIPQFKAPGIPGSEQWIFESGICRVAPRLPGDVDRLKCLGNAVVPQQVYPILKEIYNLSNV